MEVDDVTPLNIHFVHEPDASAVDRAHIDLEFTRQTHGIDLLVALGGNFVEICCRIDVSSLSRSGADEGSESAKRLAAGVLGDRSIDRAFQSRSFICFLPLRNIVGAVVEADGLVGAAHLPGSNPCLSLRHEDRT